ncbi:putative glycolipid-binding domain-containing protein [Jiangella rhizosphaerae]|uniref:Transcriptional regulator n=1 Tax=Jiangella rhizosphaerae TaxID=2293569 RepID=A0A418KU13_9ACTN|nr:putative glycolipid-binding domain-containing protein [Jiangella rhizosphaerae]RIQ30101.1 transcriptional regulator [Jiangella rhizosphaerae]
MMTGHAEREVMWSALAWPATEHLVLHADGDGMRADGMIVALDGRPTRLAYTIDAGPDWTVRRLTLAPYGEPGLVLDRRDDDRWFGGDGAERPDLAGCVDVDIALTPFTNTLPIRRLGLAVGESAEPRIVYVQVDDGLTTQAVDQRYERLDTATYRYSSGDFTADLTVDGDGLVTDYPELWRRLV